MMRAVRQQATSGVARLTASGGTLLAVGQYERGAADGLGLVGQGGQLGEAGVVTSRREKAEGTHAGHPSGTDK
jgi:hypothetical protein